MPRVQSQFTSAPELAKAQAFVARAVLDLKSAPFVAWQIFRSTLRAGRRRSLFGNIWLIAPAAMTTLLCVYLQRQHIIAGGPTRLPYALHVFAAMVLWQTFVDAINAPLNQLTATRHIISRSTVPNEGIILAGLLEVGLNIVVRLAALAVVLLVFDHFSALSLLIVFPLAALVLAAMGTAFGIITAVAGLLYDDVRRGLPLLLGVWFFLTPVFYAAQPRSLAHYNPATPAIEAARNSILAATFNATLLASLALSLLALSATWLLYRLARPYVIERLG